MSVSSTLLKAASMRSRVAAAASSILYTWSMHIAKAVLGTRIERLEMEEEEGHSVEKELVELVELDELVEQVEDGYSPLRRSQCAPLT